MRIPLKSGDRVVASAPLNGMVLVFTEFGEVFRVSLDNYGGYLKVEVA